MSVTYTSTSFGTQVPLPQTSRSPSPGISISGRSTPSRHSALRHSASSMVTAPEAIASEEPEPSSGSEMLTNTNVPAASTSTSTPQSAPRSQIPRPQSLTTAPTSTLATQTPRPEALEILLAQQDAFIRFLGGTPPPRQPATNANATETTAYPPGLGQSSIPPSYRGSGEVDAESLPSYSKNKNIENISAYGRRNFISGFFWPPLWLVGMILPFVKPSSLDPTLDNRSKKDKEAENAEIRAVELKWALRCALALLILVILIAVAVVLAVVLTRH